MYAPCKILRRQQVILSVPVEIHDIIKLSQSTCKSGHNQFSETSPDLELWCLSIWSKRREMNIYTSNTQYENRHRKTVNQQVPILENLPETILLTQLTVTHTLLRTNMQAPLTEVIVIRTKRDTQHLSGSILTLTLDSIFFFV